MAGAGSRKGLPSSLGGLFLGTTRGEMQGVCFFFFLPCARVHVPSYGLPALPWTMAPALTGWLCVEVPGTGLVHCYLQHPAEALPCSRGSACLNPVVRQRRAFP